MWFRQKYNLLLLACLLSSCATIDKVSGYMPSSAQISSLVVGEMKVDEVRKRLGDPSFTSAEPKLTWIYIRQKSETFAFFRPKISERQVLSVSFDGDSILRDIRRYNQDDDAPLEFSKEVVASEGRKITFWQQIFGNIGNFSSEQFFD